MKQVRRSILLAAALLALPRCSFADPPPPTTAPSVGQAIANLAADDYDERERASRQLFSFGLAAEPALREVVADTNLPEVRNRAQRILNHFAHGIFADTPDEVVAAADRYQHANESEKRNLLRTLAGQGGYGYIVLTRLAEEETDADLKDFIGRLIVSESRQVAATAATRLIANDVDAAERILAVASRSGEEPTARAYAALLLDQGRLDPAINALRGHLANAKGTEAAKAARALAYLLRAANRLDEAAAAANQSGDPATIRTIALDRHDWHGLAEIIAKNLPAPEATAQSPGEIGILAAAQQWAGETAAFQATIDRLAALGRTNEAATTGAANAMLLNGQVTPAIDLLLAKQRFQTAFELLFYAGRYDEAMNVARRAAEERHPDALALGASSARIEWRLGRRAQAREALDAVAAALAGAQTFDLNAYVALCEAERDVARTEADHAARPRQYAIVALNAAPPNTPFGALFDKLFPGNGGHALQWWDLLRQLKPDEPVESRFDTTAAIVNRTITDRDFDVIARAAVNGAWLQRLNDSAAREKVLQLLSDTLVRANRKDAAETYLDMLATQREGRNDWINVGLRQADKGDFNAAAGYFARAGNDANAFWLRGWALGKAGDAEGAKRWCELAQRRTLGDERQLALLVGAMDSRGDADGANALRQRILRVGPPRTITYFQACQRLGDDAARHDDIAAAADHFQVFLLTTMEVNVFYPDVSNYLALPLLVDSARAQALARAGADKLPAAAAQFRAGLAIAPGWIQIAIDCVPDLRRLAKARPGGEPNEVVARQLFDDVAGRLRTMLKQYPDSGFLHNEFAWLCVRCDYEAAEALAHATRAVELLPTDTASIDTLAEVYYRRGDGAKAVELMRKCEALEPNQPRHTQRREQFEKPPS